MARKKVESGPRPRNDAYTMMLFITFVAVVTGCILLYLDFDEQGGQTNPPPTPTLTIPKLGDPAGAGPLPKATPAPVTPAPAPEAAPAPPP